MRSSVVFPHPEGPSSVKNLPDGMSRSKSVNVEVELREERRAVVALRDALEANLHAALSPSLRARRMG
jgi:hypothetical protein